MGFPSPSSMLHRVLNQIWTFFPFPSETNQLHEPPGQASNLDMDLLFAWGLCGVVEKTADWDNNVFFLLLLLL